MFVFCRASGSSSASAGKNDDSELPAEYLNSPLYKQSLKESQSPAAGGMNE